MTARPGYSFVGEEGGRIEGPDKTHTWYVDPLDGTTNFLHGIPQFAISIGLEREGAMIAGLVYNPVSDEMFIAEKGKGAFLNDQRIRVSGRRSLHDAVVACGLPHRGRGDLASWDMAAGILLVREAGGYISDCDGTDAMLAKGHIVAGNETLQKELLAILKRTGAAS